MTPVLLEICGWRVAKTSVKEELKYVMKTIGAQYVMTTGTPLVPALFANNWDFPQEVQSRVHDLALCNNDYQNTK